MRDIIVMKWIISFFRICFAGFLGLQRISQSFGSFENGNVTEPLSYTDFWDVMRNNGVRQTKQYITDVFQLAPDITKNPAIIPWIYDDKPGHPDMLICWCTHVHCFYRVVTVEENGKDWKKKVLKNDYIEMFNDHNGSGRLNLKYGKDLIILYQYQLCYLLCANQYRGYPLVHV